MTNRVASFLSEPKNHQKTDSFLSTVFIYKGGGSGPGLQAEPLGRLGQVGHAGLLRLMLDVLQGPNLRR